MEGAGEEGAILNDGTTTEGEDWNGYTSGDFYWVFLPSSLTQKHFFYKRYSCWKLETLLM